MIGIYLTSGQLTRFNPDREPVLDLAESVDVADDAMSATVTLHDGLVYSDGTPVLAEDIQYAVERNREGTGASFVATIESVDVVDERTATLNLYGPDPDLLSWMAERGFQIHPKSLIEEDPEGYWSNPVSAGPYVVEDGWNPGDDVFRATENPEYHKGPMMAQAIEHVSVPDVPSRILQLNGGDMDMAYDLPLASAEDLDDDVETQIEGVGGMNYVIFNQELGGPFASQEVRQAVSLAIDRQRVSDVAFFGLQPPATSPLFDCGEICEPNQLPNNGERDLEAAQALMEEAGYADGFSAEMSVSSGRGGWQDAAILIAEDLSDLNIDITVTPVDEGQHYSSIGEGTYEMFFTGGGGHHQAAVSQMLEEGDFWVAATGWTPPEGASELVQRSAQALDEDERREIYNEVQAMWAEASHVISVVERVQLSGHTVPDGILVPQVANDQKVLIQTVAEAEAGARAGDL
jgi:peptide/nickel transport system substrate-binding protein